MFFHVKDSRSVLTRIIVLLWNCLLLPWKNTDNMSFSMLLLLAGLALLYMNWFQTRLPRHLTRAYTVRACIFSLRCHQGNLVFDCRSKCLDHERRLCDKLSLGHIWCKFVYIDMFCIWTLRFYLVQSQWTNMYLNTEPTRLGLRPGQLFRGWTRILVIFKKIFQFFIDFWL